MKRKKTKKYISRFQRKIAGVFEDGGKMRFHEYKLTFNRKSYSVFCPEFWDVADIGSEPRLYVPEYLIPHRPYPLCVYLYALHLYITNPKIGQRAAAESTRVYFGLATFAHTTLGRALKKLIKILTMAQSDSVSAETQTAATTIASTEEPNRMPNRMPNQSVGIQKTFPQVEDTHAIRSRLRFFFSDKLSAHIVNRESFLRACHMLAWAWYRKKRLLLL